MECYVVLKKLLKWAAIGWAVIIALFVLIALIAPLEDVEVKDSPAAKEEKKVSKEEPSTIEKEEKVKPAESKSEYLTQEELDSAVEKADIEAEITKTKVTGNHVAIWATVGTNLTTKLTYASARHRAVDIAEILSKLNRYDTATIIMSAPGTDVYGNDKDVEALKVSFTRDIINKINYSNFNPDNLKDVSTFYSTTE